MADDETTEETPGHDPVDALLDLVVYAPLGFVTDARRVVPELAQKGRAQAAMGTLGRPRTE